METIQTFMRSRYSSNSLNIILLFLVLIVFHDAVETQVFLPGYNLLFVGIRESWYLDIIILIITLYAWSHDLVHKRPSFIPIIEFSLIIILLSVILIYYSHFSELFSKHFLYFKIFPQIRYADAISSIGLLYLIHAIRFIHNTLRLKKTSGIQSFIADNASEIILKDDDMTGANHFANVIADSIKGHQERSSLSIGIVGTWGSGKSTLLLTTKRVLQENCIIVDFQPWKSESSQTIISDFFSLLCEEIGNYDGRINNAIKTYKRSLLIASKSNTILESISTLLFKNSSIESSYEEVDSAVKQLKKKVVVMIDDIDRLKGEEITEVLRLVRNTASFQNFVFICAYDKKYVTDVLRNSKVEKQENSGYIEKIFQVEFQLPVFEADKLIEYTRKNLVRLLGTEKEGEITFCLNFLSKNVHDPRYSKFHLVEYLPTIRSSIRFCNALVLDYRMVKEYDLYFFDFFMLELIKFNVPDLYFDLYHNSFQHFQQNQGDTIMLELKSSKPQPQIWKEISDDKYSYLLELVFPNNATPMPNSVRKKSMFSLYFSHHLFSKQISKIEFAQSLSSQESLYKYIDASATNGKLISVLHYLKNYSEFQTVDEYYTAIEGVFYAYTKIYSTKNLYESDSLLSEVSIEAIYNRLYIHAHIPLFAASENVTSLKDRIDEFFRKQNSGNDASILIKSFALSMIIAKQDIAVFVNPGNAQILLTEYLQRCLQAATRYNFTLHVIIRDHLRHFSIASQNMNLIVREFISSTKSYMELINASLALQQGVITFDPNTIIDIYGSLETYLNTAATDLDREGRALISDFAGIITRIPGELIKKGAAPIKLEKAIKGSQPWFEVDSTGISHRVRFDKLW